MDQITRRQFLQIAGGITFLSLIPVAKGLFAAPDSASTLPRFTSVPYIQPGSASKLIDGQDTLVVCWQTENLPADFEVSYGLSKKYGKKAPVGVAKRASGAARMASDSVADPSVVLSYSAPLTGLHLYKKYYYQVKGNGQVIAEGFATTRKPRGSAIQFAAFGDNSCDDVDAGDLTDRAIAYYAYLSNPDFVMNTGDNVYESGLDSEYTRYFFPIYNSDTADPTKGAPLLRSIPYYTVMANHDVAGKAHLLPAEAGNEAVADFDRSPDSLAYYTAMHLPLNGPSALTYPTPIVCTDPNALAQFKACAGDRFPTMANYSFDYGDAHFLCLDSNTYLDPTDAALQTWIAQDLQATDATWKFVVYHHPAYNVGHEHYMEQQMRVLSPIFETHKVDIVLHGHEHTYQRTMPLKFAPTDTSRCAALTSKDRRVPGTFTLDTKFDGVTNTAPDGIIYITTGAGGKEMYDPGYTDNPTMWMNQEDPNVQWVAKFYSDEHSLSLFQVDGKSCKWVQKTASGNIIDTVIVTKV